MPDQREMRVSYQEQRPAVTPVLRPAILKGDKRVVRGVYQIGEQHHRVTASHRCQNRVHRRAHLPPREHDDVAEVGHRSDQTEDDGEVGVDGVVCSLHSLEKNVDGALIGQLQDDGATGVRVHSPSSLSSLTSKARVGGSTGRDAESGCFGEAASRDQRRSHSFERRRREAHPRGEEEEG
ncbi:hypothetical protein PFISCL1PPCAC_3524, partial [Pristionchus fissidentatus]